MLCKDPGSHHQSLVMRTGIILVCEAAFGAESRQKTITLRLNCIKRLSEGRKARRLEGREKGRGWKREGTENKKWEEREMDEEKSGKMIG